jgi:tetratricopeptide (TPR) repeat protein
MQLDLFCDNRRNILLNDAGELLRVLQLEQAMTIYSELIAEAPDDVELLAMQQQVVSWQDRLSCFYAAPVEIAGLHCLWQYLTPDTPPPLASALRGLLIEKLTELPSPELIYLPPRFHLGVILLADGQAEEAEHWFTRAIREGINERARFEVWRGKTLELLDDTQRAKEAFLLAFLEEPHDVDPELLQSPLIHELFASLEGEDHELSEAALTAWLPVWGWIQGEWALRLHDITPSTSTVFCSRLEEAERTGSLPPPRLWFEYLRYAEYLRTIARNDRELVRVRRLMRQRSEFMFDRYMEKIR